MMITIQAIAFAAIKRFLSLRPEMSPGSNGGVPALEPAIEDRFATAIRDIDAPPVFVVSSLFRFVVSSVFRNGAVMKMPVENACGALKRLFAQKNTKCLLALNEDYCSKSDGPANDNGEPSCTGSIPESIPICGASSALRLCMTASR